MDLTRELVREQLFGPARQPLQIGRYQLRRMIGRGGAGVVYEAFDPVLERNLAVKVLRADGEGGSDGDAARLRREAQALAQLQHPNIVRVFDVGDVDSVGPAATRVVYIAMELVDGASLRDVAAGQPMPFARAHPWIVAMGRGLAAAHAAGIVHRDFKPENVLLGRDARGTYDDARVLVADFGLARPLADASLEGSRPRWHGSGSPTLSGRIGGTPGYIAPEVFEGSTPGAAVDQFAFFVTVYELLYGTRPYPVDSLEAWRDAVRRAEPVRAFDAEPVPRRVVAALSRGLRADPRQRFPTMTAALAALDAPPRRVFGWLVAATGVAALTAVSSSARETETPCDRAAGVLARSLDDERRDAIDRSTGSSDVTTALDDWAARWALARRRACESADAATPLGDRALQCLDRRRAAFEATVDRLAEGSESTLGARGLLAGIPAVEPCADPATLTAAIPVPEEPARAAEAAEIRRMLAGISLRDRLGEHARATELSQLVLARAEALGDPFVLVEAKLEVGTAMRSMGERERAEPIIVETIEEAEQIRHDEVVVQAIATMLLIVAGDPTRMAEVPRLAARGEAALVRVGSPPRLVATLETSLYWVDAIRGDPRAAIAHAERGLAALAQDGEAGGPVPFSALEEVVATQRHAIGDSQRALDDLEQLLARKREVLGEENLEVAYTLKLLAQIEAETGRNDESIAHAERALAIVVDLFGPDHPILAEYHNTAATSYGAALRGDQVRHHLDRAIAVNRAAEPPDRPFLCAAMVNGLLLAIDEDDAEDAARRSEGAMEMCRIAYGDRHEIYAAAITAGGDAAAMNGRFDEARRRYEEALELLPAGTPLRNGALLGLAQVHAHAGENDRAIALLEAAVASADRLANDPMVGAAASFELGRLLWDADRDRARARSLVAKARAHYASLGDPARDAVAEIDRWIVDVAGERPPQLD